MNNLKLAFRTLFKTPLVTAIAVLSLALGIGANAGIFSLFDQILLSPLPVQDPGRLVNFANPGPKPGSTSCGQAGDCDEVFSYLMFKDIEEASGPFEGVAAHVAFGANLAQRNQTLNGAGMLVSGSYFPLLGVVPALGRLFTPEDDRGFGENYVAVLSHAYWETQFGSDPSVLNEVIVVNGQSMTIVGVAPRGFFGTTLGAEPEVFVPITMRELMSPGWEGFDNRRHYWAYLFARLKPEITIERAQADINTVYSAILNDVEAPLQEGMSDQTMGRFRTRELVLSPGQRGQSSLHKEAKVPLLMLLAITGFVLVIACGNIANLLLARGANRSQEMAVRGALGASRGQLLGQLMTESLLLAALGGVASLLVAQWTLNLMGSLLPADATQTLDLTLRGKAMGFAALLSIGTGVLFGMYPALHASRSDLAGMIRASAGQASGSRSAQRFRTTLVTAQIALSMALLIASGLFIKSLVNVSRVDLGLRPDNIITFGLSPELNGYEGEASRALFERVEEEFAALPGVTSVTSGLVPVLAGNSWGNSVSVEGFEAGPDTDTGSRFNQVSTGYFSTLGMPLLAGREFEIGDEGESEKVTIVNEAFTRKFNLNGREAVGKFMTSGDGELDTRIVGVVQDAKYSDVKQEIPPLFFEPWRQSSPGFLTFYVRTTSDPDEVMRQVPAIVSRLDPNLPVEEFRTLEAQVRDNVFLDRMISILSAAFASLATLLAGVGLYGVLAYTVAQRTREIGLRMALGADEVGVRKLVLAQVARMTVVGGVLGVLAALALGRGAQSLLFELEGYDPFVIAVVAVMVAGVAIVAGYLPALRASRIDPMVALRHE